MSSLIINQVNMISSQDWDNFVSETYGRPYCFQQQNGCQSRGTYTINVPEVDNFDSDYPDTIPEIVNGPVMGVNLKAWLARDPLQNLINSHPSVQDFERTLWWDRNFYPPIEEIANDLHAKGLLPAGEYVIDIDW